MTVAEDAAFGRRVAKVEARDLDSGEFGRITYFMEPSSAQGSFLIDPTSGGEGYLYDTWWRIPV